MESINEKHLSAEQIVRLAHTARTLMACGRGLETVVKDLVRSHGMSRNDVQMLLKLI